MIRKSSGFRRQHPTTPFIKANHHIRFPEVRVLSDQGEMLGIMPSREAQFKAQEAGKDLVLVTENAKPPVVKIIELAKYKYQLQQRLSEQRKKAKAQDLKEVRFTPFMGEGDFQTRFKRVIEFLERGDKVRLNIDFKSGRQLSKKEFGDKMMERIIQETAEIAVVETPPKMMGKKLQAQLMPSKKTKKE